MLTEAPKPPEFTMRNLQISPGRHGGFVVLERAVGPMPNSQPLFAGELGPCLEFIDAYYKPPFYLMPHRGEVDLSALVEASKQAVPPWHRPRGFVEDDGTREAPSVDRDWDAGAAAAAKSRNPDKFADLEACMAEDGVDREALIRKLEVFEENGGSVRLSPYEATALKQSLREQSERQIVATAEARAEQRKRGVFE